MSGLNTWSGLLLASGASRTYFEFSRLQSMQQWWHWPLFAALAVLILLCVITLYRRDANELPRTVRWLLTTLRLTALLGLLIFFLGIEKRTEHRIVKNSRVVLAVDTSQSMGLIDLDSQENPQGQSRAERVAHALAKEDLIGELRQQHDVVVYRFDQTEQPMQISSLAKRSSDQDLSIQGDRLGQRNLAIAESRWLWRIAAILFGVAFVGLMIHFVTAARRVRDESWGLLISVLALISALIVVGTNNVRNPQVSLVQLFRSSEAAADDPELSQEESADSSEPAPTDWLKELRPSGVSTRLGDALNFIANEERGGPIAGICLVTDGNVNAGLDWREALQVAKDAEIPVYTLGIGVSQPPRNVRVVDIEAPARVYPGDAFQMTAYLQSFGLVGQTVRVELLAAKNPAADHSDQQDVFLEERRVTLAADGEVRSFEFQIEPDEIGKVRYRIRVKAPPGDLDANDNQQSCLVQIVDRKTKLLILAGGPTREYQFFRTMCYRDHEITSDVLLQHAQGEIAQDADAILDSFPSFAEEMFEYDCVIAFDPDWMSMDEEQIQLLERWVAEKAGGLILVAGPVYTPEWTSLAKSRRADDLIRALYPVTFYQRTGSLLSRGRYVASKPWPIELADEGRGARFLWLGDSALDSSNAWSRFEGVYGYQPVRGAKPAAAVYGRFSNPDSEIDGELPVFLAGQFYGSGRVFYIASGEFWRLNELDTNYFDQLYTKLIRYISEGRLLRDSSRGTLLVSKDRCVLGETIVVRASLSDPQFRPLDQAEVMATLVYPDGNRSPLILQKVQETGQAGSFSGQFVAASEGDFRVELPVPDSPELEILGKTVRARLPDREVESPQRNDAVLSELAETTGGKYFVGLESAIGQGSHKPSTATDGSGANTRAVDGLAGDGNATAVGTTVPLSASQRSTAGLVASLTPQGQETYFPGAPDKDFQQRLMAWLIALICGTLSLEWLFRRLHRLA